MEEIPPSQAVVSPKVASPKPAISDKLPPVDEEAEAAALGSMLISEQAAGSLISMLRERDFYNPLHREVFKAMLGVSRAMKQIDVVSVKSELIARDMFDKVGGPEFLMQLVDTVPSAANAEHYAQIVIDMAVLRALHGAGHEIVKIVHEPQLDVQQKVDQSERCVFDATQRRLGKDFTPIETLADQFFHDVDRVAETGQPLFGLPSGFKPLDDLLTGFYPGNLIILAARPAVGKTSLALTFAINAAKKSNGTVAIFSMEMSDIEITRRLICTEARVNSNVLKRSKLPDGAYEELAKAVDRLYGLKVYVDDSSDLSPFEMRAKCRRLKAATGNLSLVVVDYLQLMRALSRTENRTQQISEIARSLKNFAKELDVPIIALSQLARKVELRTNKRPMMSDLRESGSIEADADVVMLLYREDYYKDATAEGPPPEPPDPETPVDVEVRVAKNRNGATGTVHLAFIPAFTLFTAWHGHTE